MSDSQACQASLYGGTPAMEGLLRPPPRPVLCSHHSSLTAPHFTRCNPPPRHLTTTVLRHWQPAAD
ncbi:hypothetical protein E2C01_070586 [Portunus trituberculatus]|uniref:Uncharacterized protein n=1 Tax=Portunus trituberculatus TaxID=210409 RepID=A0A5B7HUJ2_PORTR|nr:hypothetical protein [Portunus trituberculatus]